VYDSAQAVERGRPERRRQRDPDAVWRSARARARHHQHSHRGGNQPDPNAANNTDRSRRPSTRRPTWRSARRMRPIRCAGHRSTTQSLSQHRPLECNRVTVTDTLPAGLSFSSATPSQGAIAASQASGRLAAGRGRKRHAGTSRQRVAGDPGRDYKHGRRARCGARSNLADNSPASDVVQAVADLVVTKSDAPTRWKPNGADVHHLLHQRRAVGATNVYITDTLRPDDLWRRAQRDAVHPGPVQSGQTLTWSIASLAAGASAALSLA